MEKSKKNTCYKCGEEEIIDENRGASCYITICPKCDRDLLEEYLKHTKDDSVKAKIQKILSRKEVKKHGRRNDG